VGNPGRPMAQMIQKEIIGSLVQTDMGQ